MFPLSLSNRTNMIGLTIVFDLLGHVIVHHMLNCREIQTLGGHIRGY